MSRKRGAKSVGIAPSRKHGTGGGVPPADLAVFREAVADVTPLVPDNRVHIRPPQARTRPIVRSAAAAFEDDLSDHLALPQGPGEPLRFHRPGVQRQALRQLGRGTGIEDELDLHGLTVSDARRLLVTFLNRCARSGVRRVRIIHGKGLRSESGEGVLKGLVAGWLAQRDDVLAFRQAPADGGGSGAVVVLLRAAR